MFADGYGPRRGAARRRSRRRRAVRVVAPLAVPVALGLTLGIILAVSSGPSVTHVNQQTGTVATTSPSPGEASPSSMPAQPQSTCTPGYPATAASCPSARPGAPAVP